MTYSKALSFSSVVGIPAYLATHARLPHKWLYVILEVAVFTEVVVSGIVYSHAASMERSILIEKVEAFAEIDGQRISLQKAVVGQVPGIALEKERDR